MTYDSTSRLTWKETPIWLRVVVIIAFANFASFWIIAVVSGGDALNGKREGDRYFLMSHGHYTEVSKSFFDYSRIHASSVLITHPGAMIGVAWYFLRRKTHPPGGRSVI